MTFGSNIIFTKTLMIEVDPAGADQFHIMKAPSALTILEAYMVSENNLGAGTAFTLTLQNWGTAGTAVQTSGTIAVANGTGLSANVPLAATLTEAAQYIADNEWLVLDYAETGGGWQSGDRAVFTFNYVLGKGI
jgi:hypothetical protein